ncbi:putative SNF2 family helicase/ATPase [Talaromyces proteolyticus]|uniref:SNF2 family helicase/ATPase n=1 Tax=Talaromyces proteolyticus TaxID=1131652 RepID=A0AAD4PXP2_9EURO|nr:putative SNF2 family helicase/ATPase [Talaromyces proteolyticus]KAH8693534.1 putative SNF2 family helicase/ATPase [Talaromyces proteolyticus]
MVVATYTQNISDATTRSIENSILSQATRDHERPNKRRKLDEDTDDILSQSGNVSVHNDYVVLCRIIINLIPPQETSIDLSPDTQELPVFLNYRCQTENAEPLGTEFEDPASSSESLEQQHWLDVKSVQGKDSVFMHNLSGPNVDEMVSHLSLATKAAAFDTAKLDHLLCKYRARLSFQPNAAYFQLTADILWKNSLLIPALSRIKPYAETALLRYTPRGEGIYKSTSNDDAVQSRQRQPFWTPRDFYDNVHIPAETPESSADLRCNLAVCQLYPFQNRAVRWLLEKEGVEINKSGNLVPRRKDVRDCPEFFEEFTDAEGRRCYVSHLYKVVTTDLSEWSDSASALQGGILAEEMGLGKTVEMILLICLHSREVMLNHQSEPKNNLVKSGATLIITPPAILEQWKQEIATHAPSLSVFEYTGFQQYPKATDEELLHMLAGNDVVLTTYNVIAKEVHHTGVAPTWTLRHEKKRKIRTTPLIGISWWRVCLDEAQMIESGVSNAARVARLIPRVNAWAVTGTPIRKDMRDLFGLLQFLKYEPICSFPALWAGLYNEHYPAFKSIINRLALRHSKDLVRKDLRLPPQKRVVITIPFTPVEEQHYSHLFEQMCADCGLESSGAPLTEDWNPESQSVIEKMRSWLTRLRQTCLHPEVAGSNRKALGLRTGPLRSVAEVLEVMIDQNETLIRAEERTLLLSHARRGQLLENAAHRWRALDIWQKGLKRATEIVTDCREQLRVEHEKTQSSAGNSAEQETSDVDSDKEESEETEKNSRLRTCKMRLRSALEVQHIFKFFTANAFYQIKTDINLTEPDSNEFTNLERDEIEAYEAAKQMRKEMLTDVSRKVRRYMKVIQDKSKSKSFVKIPAMNAKLRTLGLESRRVFMKLEDFCDAMNEHSNQYNEWRDIMVKLLSQSLIDEEESSELEGNEYETSTKHQDEMYVYMEALRVMYADRHDALTGQQNFLIDHEVKIGLSEAGKGEGPSPPLYLEIMKKRNELKPTAELGSLRGIISELRSLVTSLEWQSHEGSSRAEAELTIATEVLDRASKISTDQAKASSNLEKEVELFRDTMNQRLEYYRQLQQISDTVAPYDEESVGKPLDEAVYSLKLQAEEKMEQKLSSLQSKGRYLIHLRDDSGPDDSSRMCVICQSSFEIGVLTVCGHKYCKDCLRLWWYQHRTCPTCKRKLKANDFHQIAYKPQELVVQEERSPVKSGLDTTTNSFIYSDISTGMLQEIKNVDLSSSFGTKIDTLARHLIWLREHDPGAKSIVFSQYKHFLGVLGTAFSRFDIGFSNIDAKDGIHRFKEDPAVECFLLHAKAHSSGLNLVNATHVFLCEPLINTAIELQAIARVHRIGQHRSTTVWMYLVSDTVEESIYQISVSRRLSHIVQKEKKEKDKEVQSPSPGLRDGSTVENLTETAIDSANSMEMQDATLGKLLATGAAGGELVRKDDLWQCLFGGMQKMRPSGQTSDAGAEVDRFLRAEAADQRRPDAPGS